MQYNAEPDRIGHGVDQHLPGEDVDTAVVQPLTDCCVCRSIFYPTPAETKGKDRQREKG